ncbi:MAG TPA: VOC family protein [Vulgatibacter sp.]|nr:VOC family protein [Vulgatibacter sp.]
MGRFVWYELLTTDTEGAKSFYTDLIGWKVKHDPDGYDEWRVGEGSIGGVMELPTDARAGGASPFWLGYVAVKDVDAAADQAAKLGGRVHRAPADIPGVGRFAVLADPQGAHFGIFSAKR